MRTSSSRGVRPAWAALVCGLGISACFGASSTLGDSETHFLIECAETCPEGLSCECGVCTKTCDATDECTGLSGDATCSDSPPGLCPDTRSLCDVECDAPSDCNSLGEGYRCDAGRCRKPGGGGVGGNGGTGGVGGNGAGGVSGASGSGAVGSGGGVTGIGGAAGAGPGGTGGTAPGNCCVEPRIEWGIDGGLGGPRARFALSCSTFEKLTSEGALLCESDLPGCTSDTYLGHDPNTVIEALAHPDVVTALQDAPVVYGNDARALDGTVLRIIVDGAIIDVGYECQTDNCTPIPEGVLTLKLVLEALQTQQVGIQGCAQGEACGGEIGADPCDAIITMYTFDRELHQCVAFTSGGCPEGPNAFTTYEECAETCGNDPCTGGTLADNLPPECGTFAEGLCFTTSVQACHCACYVDGNSLDRCSVIEPIPPAASCTN